MTTKTQLPASDKQKMFLKTLMEMKEHSFAVVDVDSLNLKEAKDLISALLQRPKKAGVVERATDKQLSYAQSLVQKKVGGLDLLNTHLQAEGVSLLEALPKEVISQLIGALKFAPDVADTISITDVGAYLLEGSIYSIRKGNQSGRWQVWSYDKRLGKYQREPISTKEREILKKVQPTDRLTLALAVKYSAHTGLCVHCGRTLTLLKSVAGGMGAVCAKKYH